jgi:hypothetical protein
MLEQDTQGFMDALTERTIGLRDSITLKEVIIADIPKGIKVYIRTEVIRWLRNDLAGAPRFGRVNQNAPGISQLTNAFLRSLCDAYQFTRTEFISILNDAVHFTDNFLSRPQWTLENFVFEKNKRIPTEELLFRLEYTSDYTYFPQLIEKIVRQWKWKEVTREDFRTLVAKIDNQIVGQHSARELAMLTKPIYDFLHLGEASLTHAISLSPLIVFFDDKKMSGVKEHIESVCAARKRSELTLRELVGLIEDFYSSRTGAQARSGNPLTDKPKTQADETARETAPSDAAKSSGRSPEAGVSQETSDPTDRAIQNAMTAEKGEGNAEGTTPPATLGLPDLHTLIPDKKRARIVRRLFKKDPDYFNFVVAELNKFTSWKESASFLADFFRTNKLDPYADDVVQFTDAVQARFTPREQ